MDLAPEGQQIWPVGGMIWLPCCAWGSQNDVFSCERGIQCAPSVLSVGVRADAQIPTWLLVVGHVSVTCAWGNGLDLTWGVGAGEVLVWAWQRTNGESHKGHHDNEYAHHHAICRLCLLMKLCPWTLCCMFCHVPCGALFQLALTTLEGSTCLLPNSSHWMASARGGE